MKKYGVRVLVQMSTFIEIEASDETSATENAKAMFYSGELMGDLNNHEYYDRVDTDVEIVKDIEEDANTNN